MNSHFYEVNVDDIEATINQIKNDINRWLK